MPADRPALSPPLAPGNSLREYKLCVVCLGNICRSPMAEALLAAELEAAGLAGRVSVESAGTGDWHLGEGMDRRAHAELARRGLDGSGHRARQIDADWLGRFDLLVAMDASNLRALRAMAGGRAELLERIVLLRSFDPSAPAGAEVPDPYGGSAGEFAEVYDMMQSAARQLVAAIADLLGEPDSQPG